MPQTTPLTADPRNLQEMCKTLARHSQGTCGKPAGKLRETCGNPAGNLQETCRKTAGNRQGTRGKTHRKPAGHLQEASRKSAGNLRETCRELAGNLQETFGKPAGTPPSSVRSRPIESQNNHCGVQAQLLEPMIACPTWPPCTEIEIQLSASLVIDHPVFFLKKCLAVSFVVFGSREWRG